MVLLIPSTIVLPSWNISSVSVHDFLLSLTLGCVIFSIFVKTITITPLIRYFKIDAMDDVEEFGYIE